MLYEIAILVLGMMVGIILLIIVGRFKQINIQKVIPILEQPLILPAWGGLPVEIEVDKTISDKTKWICDQGVKMLTGWKSMPNIDIKFCKPETMPECGRSSGVFYFDTPNIIYINASIVEQSWLVTKIALHELYHLYQFNLYKTTNDVDKTVNQWSDQVMDSILFAGYYKEKGINNMSGKVFKCPGKFTQIKSSKFAGTVWSVGN